LHIYWIELGKVVVAHFPSDVKIGYEILVI